MTVKALNSALNDVSALCATAKAQVMHTKASNFSMVPSAGVSQFSGDISANRARLALFRGWVHSAVHAKALEASSSPVHVARISGLNDVDDEERSKPGNAKSMLHRKKMPRNIEAKAADQEMELLPAHPLTERLRKPNPIQNRSQFVYSFVASLDMTGWGFIVFDQGEDGDEYYSLPTTWVKPDHTNGPFAEFRVVDPNDPTAGMDSKPLTREQVAFAYFPDPSNPLAAKAPAQAQIAAIRIDDHIQTSQDGFFERGVFPSVVVTIGSNPLGDGQTRPKLTGHQRRAIQSSIRNMMGGVANYGNIAIVDGMVEKIDPLSMKQTEMGWEKSEQAVRTRILSAFGVHPFILGEPVNVGGYSQAAVIVEQFCKRVNASLDMLSILMTDFAGRREADDLIIWYEKCEPHDPEMEARNMQFARRNNDISQDEYRMFLGFAPDEDRNESVISAKLSTSVSAMFPLLALGQVSPEQATAYFEGLGLPNELATQLAGTRTPQAVLDDAVDGLQAAVRALGLAPPVKTADLILRRIGA